MTFQFWFKLFCGAKRKFFKWNEVKANCVENDSAEYIFIYTESAENVNYVQLKTKCPWEYCLWAMNF